MKIESKDGWMLSPAKKLDERECYNACKTCDIYKPKPTLARRGEAKRLEDNPPGDEICHVQYTGIGIESMCIFGVNIQRS